MMPETMSAKRALVDLSTCTHPFSIPCDYPDDGCVIFVSSVVTTPTITILGKLLCSTNFSIIMLNSNYKTMFLFSTLVPLLASGHSIFTNIHDTL